MQGSTYVHQLQDAANSRPDLTKEGNLFTEFVATIGAQVRSSYQTRHTPDEMIDQAIGLWSHLQVRCTDLPTTSAAIEGHKSVFVTLMPDQPFIVDTVRLLFQTKGVNNITGYNLVVHIGRDAAGKIIRIADTADPLESIVRLETDALDTAQMQELPAQLSKHLQLAQIMVQDFDAIRGAVSNIIETFSANAKRTNSASMKENADCLQWLLAENFVFMGAILTPKDGEPRRLGFARNEVEHAWAHANTDDWPKAEAGGIEIRKGLSPSPVHRGGRVDEVRVVSPSDDGSPGDVLTIQGLFTYRGITAASRHVPRLRIILGNILENQTSKPGSYRFKGISNVFDSLPTEFLFTATADEIKSMIDQVLEAEHDRDVRVHIIQHPKTEATFVLAAMPRHCWSDDLRRRIQETVGHGTQAAHCDHGVFVGRYETMLVHFYLTGTSPLSDKQSQDLIALVTDLATPWLVQVSSLLVDRLGRQEAAALTTEYGHAFEPMYTRMTSPQQTVSDIEFLERLPDSQAGILVDVYADIRGRVTIRIYQATDVILSDIMPVLDNFGLRIIDQFADPVTPRSGNTRYLDTFRVQGVWGLDTTEILQGKGTLIQALEAVFAGDMPNDILNRILLRANIPWAAVDMIRAYARYARQLGSTHTLRGLQEILLAWPNIIPLLWKLFAAKFDPHHNGHRKRMIADAVSALDAALSQIENNEQDTAFRTLFNLIKATKRTNFYRDDRPCHYLSFKIQCEEVESMPFPKMMVETYVHHREVEGIHIRGGKVARGGIRWSDREDYRREVFDLVSTQMVKNVLIVPEGAKGGFFLKHAPADPGKRRARADELYKIFIRGLLDVTDNIVDGQVVQPPNVVPHDGDDPYLVVAADKGTAHLSDTANELAISYDFWLADAFASGGSNGYDHKKVGITARGAWVTARRHFYEMGIDPTVDEFTAIGIGDPSGDVFGNGVVEHEKMKLVAAFNHRHIFIDPNPDPEISWKERKRLFDAGLGWDHYDQSTLSPGGRIYSRTVKSIELTPEIKERLGLLKDEVPVDMAIRIILRLDVDLFWNGGIGTYVKATSESHADAGDPINNQVRIDADELRCKIIGEGGNLGLTQAGRIEYALRGGRINNDAVDNSGGVDMSDHEVNLKILLNPLVTAGTLEWSARNRLLERLTEGVAAQVLANSDTHGLQLSLDQLRSQKNPMQFSRAIDWICQRRALTRSDLKLPSDQELRNRASVRQGLTRPELAVLSANIKMEIAKALLSEEGVEIPDFESYVLNYFPQSIQKKFSPQIKGHLLYKSIGMTALVTNIMGNSGAIFFPALMELTGKSASEVASGWVHAMRLIGAEQIKRGLIKAEVSRDTMYRSWLGVTNSVLGLVALWLTEENLDLNRGSDLQTALSRLSRTRGAGHGPRLREYTAGLTTRGVPTQLANRLAALAEITAAWEICRTHDDGDRWSHNIVKYMALGEASRILPAIRTMEARQAQGGWEPVALGILRTRYVKMLRALAAVVPIGPEVRLGIDRVRTKLRLYHLTQLQHDLDHILKDAPTLAALLVAEQRIWAHIAESKANQAKSISNKQ